MARPGRTPPPRSDGFYVPGANPDRDNSGNPADPPDAVNRHIAGSPATAQADTDVVTAADYPTMWARLKITHDSMHGFVAMGGAYISFRDPFVFFLHSNVDRLYAMWQTAVGHPERRFQEREPDVRKRFLLPFAPSDSVG